MTVFKSCPNDVVLLTWHDVFSSMRVAYPFRANILKIIKDASWNGKRPVLGRAKTDWWRENKSLYRKTKKPKNLYHEVRTRTLQNLRTCKNKQNVRHYPGKPKKCCYNIQDSDFGNKM